jgi:hypothetical protein
MADLKKYWSEVRALEKALPASVWLISLENHSKGQTGGAIVEVKGELAARLLHTKSHRTATEAEIEAHKARQDDLQRRTFQQRLRDQGIAVVPVR